MYRMIFVGCLIQIFGVRHDFCRSLGMVREGWLLQCVSFNHNSLPLLGFLFLCLTFSFSQDFLLRSSGTGSYTLYAPHAFFLFNDVSACPEYIGCATNPANVCIRLVRISYGDFIKAMHSDLNTLISYSNLILSNGVKIQPHQYSPLGVKEITSSCSARLEGCISAGCSLLSVGSTSSSVCTAVVTPCFYVCTQLRVSAATCKCNKCHSLSCACHAARNCMKFVIASTVKGFTQHCRSQAALPQSRSACRNFDQI